MRDRGWRTRTVPPLLRLPSEASENPTTDRATFWAPCRAAEAVDTDALTAIADAAVSAGLPTTAVDKTIASAVRTTGAAGVRCDHEAAS